MICRLSKSLEEQLACCHCEEFCRKFQDFYFLDEADRIEQARSKCPRN